MVNEYIKSPLGIPNWNYVLRTTPHILLKDQCILLFRTRSPLGGKREIGPSANQDWQ